MSEKNETREDILNQLAKMLFGSEGFVEGQCSRCNKKVSGREDFDDDLSWQEYGLSHFCQTCQDITFADPEEEE